VGNDRLDLGRCPGRGQAGEGGHGLWCRVPGIEAVDHRHDHSLAHHWAIHIRLDRLCVMPADLDALVALMPFAGQLGLVLDEASADRVIARLDWAPSLCTSGGIMHGGVLMSLADSAGALVTFLGLPEGATTATITSTSQLFRPVSTGTVRAVAVPLHRGRTTVTAQTSLYNSEQRLVAQTTQIQAVRPAPPPT
jgi:1,4-dihydroxy-2-naphthoyl-CoA hydrolase